MKTPDMVYSCSLCGMQYSRMWSLNRHRKKCKDLPEFDNSHADVKLKTGKPSSTELMEDVSTESEDDKLTESEDDKLTESEDDKLTESEDDKLTENVDGKLPESEVDAPVESEEIDDDATDTESSESLEEEEKDDVTMAEKEKNDTMIKWPVSRAYLINYPWSYWGEVPRIKKHIKWLERMRDAEPPTIVYNIQNASVSQIGALCEIAYNYLNFQIPAERSNWKEIRKQKRAIRLLANPDVDIEDKREEVLRRGANFVQLLLHVVDPLLLFDIPRKIHIDVAMKNISDEAESVAHEDCYYISDEAVRMDPEDCYYVSDEAVRMGHEDCYDTDNESNKS